MALVDSYTILRPSDETKFEARSFYKIKDLSSTLIASFSYLLFSPHDLAFLVKRSIESRMYNPSTINNLDFIQDDLKEAIKSCSKLPQINFVIFY